MNFQEYKDAVNKDNYRVKFPFGGIYYLLVFKNSKCNSKALLSKKEEHLDKLLDAHISNNEFNFQLLSFYKN